MKHERGERMTREPPKKRRRDRMTKDKRGQHRISLLSFSTSFFLFSISVAWTPSHSSLGDLEVCRMVTPHLRVSKHQNPKEVGEKKEKGNQEKLESNPPVQTPTYANKSKQESRSTTAEKYQRQ